MNRFRLPLHVLRRGCHWHVLSKQRSCPLIARFSSIRAWVTQPCHLHSPWESFEASGVAFNIHCLYKGIRIPSSSPTTSLYLRPSNLELQRPSSHLLSTRASTSTMSGSGGQGKWMVSSVKEKDIAELRAAGYLAKEIAHRLPAQGQVSPHRSPMRGWFSSLISSVG